MVTRSSEDRLFVDLAVGSSEDRSEAPRVLRLEALSMSRRPSWACPEYERHGDVACRECLRLYGARGPVPQARDSLPPRMTFGQGWFSLGATHWFEASDDTLFPSRDGRRLLAQAACGGICEVTSAWAPRPGSECRKCLRALRRATSQAPSVPAESSGGAGAPSGKLLRLYRGLTKPYDPDRVRRNRTSGTDFTDCPYTALCYATGPKGMVLVVDVPEGAPHVSEELWLDSSAKRFMIWGSFDEFIVARLAAKELRAQVRQKGVVAASDEYKAYVLRRYVEDRRREVLLH